VQGSDREREQVQQADFLADQQPQLLDRQLPDGFAAQRVRGRNEMRGIGRRGRPLCGFKVLKAPTVLSGLRPLVHGLPHPLFPEIFPTRSASTGARLLSGGESVSGG
jgi:hypothetical protein